MKVSISWLKELVDLNCSIEELVKLLPLRSISTKEITDQFIELDMKGYNRSDLLSMIGVAQEVAAITGSKLLLEEPDESKYVWNTLKLPKTGVEVKDPKLAPYYTITKIENLRVGKSSPEVVKKLEESGLRSIDNLTDITNLVMLEYGQPLHSFDAEKVKGGIQVRAAKKNEKIKTIDGKEREFSESDLVIADDNGPIGIAGIMGGKDSEVSENTTTIYLEAGIFDPVNTRRTTVALGLPSEASTRFQHGLTKTRHNQALNTAIKMYEELGGKVTAINMVGNFVDKKKTIMLTKEKLELLVGVKFEDSQVEDYLKRLYFEVKKEDGGWEVQPPYFRLDVDIQEDVIEEVARMYGYEKIPAEKVSESDPLQTEDPIFKIISDLRSKLVDLGLTEVQTYSFYSTYVLNALSIDRPKLVKVANPISSETEYLRQSIWPNLLEVVSKNMRQGFKDIAVFEIGKAFYNVDGSPKEDYRLAVALCNGTDNPLGELYQITQRLGIHLESVKLNPTLFHPTRHIGGLSEVHLRVLNKLGIEKRVAVLEITIS